MQVKKNMPYLIFDVHLVKFINAADAIVSKHQSTSLKQEFIDIKIK